MQYAAGTKSSDDAVTAREVFQRSTGFPIRATVIALSLGLTLTVSGCLGASEDGAMGSADGATPRASVAAVSASSTVLGPAPLPVYSVGDRYVFDNPRETWTITTVTDQKIAWTSDLDGSRETTLDPLLPSLRSAAPEIGAVTRIITEKKGDIWPLVVGNETRFVVAAGMDQPPYSQSLAWTCRVVGTNQVTVPAGSFDAYKIACARSDGLRLNTYYAPAVGYFVRREVSTADHQVQARSLIAYKNGAGNPLVAAHSPGAAALNPLGTGAAGATASARATEVTSLAPMDEPAHGGPGSAMGSEAAVPTTPSEPPNAAAPHPLVPPSTDAAQAGSVQAGSVQAGVPQRSQPSATAMYQGAGAVSANTPSGSTGGQMSPPATTPSAASQAGPGGAWHGFGVRLASFGSQAAADTGWTKLQAAYPGPLGGLSHRVEPVLIDGRGTFHRLYAGPFPTKAAAQAVCGTIAEMGQTCDVRSF